MKAILDEKGFIISYALVGDLVDGIDLPDPDDLAHFEEHFAAYKAHNGIAAFDLIILKRNQGIRKKPFSPPFAASVTSI